MIFELAVNLLNISAFCSHLQAIFNKENILTASYIIDAVIQLKYTILKQL